MNTTAQQQMETDARFDLVFERIIDVPRELVWQAWTKPEQLKQWFTPKPWRTIDCEIDLRAGGLFRTVMQSPEGQDFPNVGCYLEVVDNERLVWTNALGRGFRPCEQRAGSAGHECDELVFTAVITLAQHANGTRYVAKLMHGDEASRQKHESMGFHEGWGAALDQLVAMIKSS